MGSTDTSLLDIGIYSISEAARLAGISAGRIRRWLRGYGYRSGKAVRRAEAIWEGQIQPMDNRIAIGFLDLMEIRFLEAFLRQGVSWSTMRQAHKLARKELGTEHPFCTNRLATDGRRLLLRQANASSDQALLDIATHQQEFLLRIVQPFLKNLEFADGTELARWWPLGKERNVVVDPARNFGQPTVAKSGVPTDVLARSLAVNPSIETVARWFEVQTDEVRDAVEFEQNLTQIGSAPANEGFA